MCIRDRRRVHSHPFVANVSSSPNAQLVAGTDQGRIYRLRMENLASIVVSENHGGPVTCVSYARGVSDRFATASGDGTVRIWDTADYGVLTTAVVRGAGEPRCLVLTQVRAAGGKIYTVGLLKLFTRTKEQRH